MGKQSVVKKVVNQVKSNVSAQANYIKNTVATTRKNNAADMKGFGVPPAKKTPADWQATNRVLSNFGPSAMGTVKYTSQAAKMMQGIKRDAAAELKRNPAAMAMEAKKAISSAYKGGKAVTGLVKKGLSGNKIRR